MFTQSEESSRLHSDVAHTLANTIQKATEHIPNPTAQTYNSLLEIYDQGKDDAKKEQNAHLFEGYITKDQFAFSIYKLTERLVTAVNTEAKIADNKTPLVAIWAFDINGLKIFNDYFKNHAMGDRLIAAIQEAIANSFRLPNDDHASRLGGDEIGVVNMQNAKDIAYDKKVKQVANEVRKTLQASFSDVPAALALIKSGSGTLSGGLQLFTEQQLVDIYKSWKESLPETQQTPLTFFAYINKHIDEASYAAKKRAKATFQTEVNMIIPTDEHPIPKAVAVEYGQEPIPKIKRLFNMISAIFRGVVARL